MTAAEGAPATITTDAVIVRYSVDQVAALCELFERPDLLAALDGAEDAEDTEDAARRAALGAAARSLVSGWVVAYDDVDGEQRLHLLEPHAQLLGTLWGATGVVAVTRETDAAEELVVVAAPDGTVVERVEVLPGVHQFTLAPAADAADRLLRFLGIDPGQDPPAGAAFDTTAASLTRLERFASGADPEEVGDVVPEQGFADAVVVPTSHGRITVVTVQPDSVEGDELSWVEGDDGVWLIDAPGPDDDRPVRVRPVSGSDIRSLIEEAL